PATRWRPGCGRDFAALSRLPARTARTLWHADPDADLHPLLCRCEQRSRLQPARLADRRPGRGADPLRADGDRPERMSWTAEAPERRPDEPALVLDLDGYEGPIDLLLTLAREQKVDLAKLSILALADQYLAFISEQRSLRLEIAADYLVMAAWLAYLKSRLLLPQPPQDEEPSGAELAAQLEHRLRLLEAMQIAGGRLMARPRTGQDVFLRGAPEGL